MHAPRRALCTFILVHACIVRISGFPQNAANDDMEIITVEEIERSAGKTKNLTAPLITQNNEDNDSNFSSTSSAKNVPSNEPIIDIADDLIFLAERTHQQLKMHQQQTTEQPIGTSQQIDLLTSAEEYSLTSALGSSSTALFKSSEEKNISKSAKDAGDDNEGFGDGYTIINNAAAAAAAAAASTHTSIVGNADNNQSSATIPQIKLRMRHVSADNTENNDDDANGNDEERNNNEETGIDDGGNNDNDDMNNPNATDFEEFDVPSIETLITPIDMSDFVALIPAATVKSIASNYYLNDPEVQRAYAYLNSRDFMILRQKIIELPEVKSFLRYLNSSGLDVVGFMNNLTNLTSKPDELLNDDSLADIGSGNDDIIGNEIENDQTIWQVTTASPLQAEHQATTEEQLNGLHGLVDSILDILPQDQILATFFEKLESNEQFSKLVDNIGRPAFAKTLHNMQNSPQLRSLVFNLHNNGIYITKIVDSLKAYFFLGTF